MVEKMADKIRVVRITRTCGACPSQWEGYTDDDRPVYIRYRWGYLSVRVGLPGQAIGQAIHEGIAVVGKQLSKPEEVTWSDGHKSMASFAGNLSNDALVRETADVLVLPDVSTWEHRQS